ncbi:hypothetical protein [Legionella sp. WA2022007384]
MPSSQLAFLCQQIENQDTDHFGKFYMYVSLLNTLTARNKSFAEGLPQYSSLLPWKNDKPIKIGEISTDFTRQLNIYSREFINSQPNWSKALYNIVMAYIRKGNVSDLIYIIDQMLDHLSAMHGKQSHNNSIYVDINFDKKKEGLASFIKEISAFNQQVLSITDNSCNTVLSLLGVTTGLVLLFTAIPIIISLPLVFAGLYGTYHFATEVISKAESLEAHLTQITEKMKKLPQDTSLFGDANHNTFFTAAVKPIPYAAVTAAEQLVFDESQQKQLKTGRDGLDSAFYWMGL